MEEECLADMVVEYGQTEMDITVCVTEKGCGAHTPAAGPIRCTDMTSNMMKVLHTPLLRPTCTLSSTAGNNICTNSGAGVYVNNNGEDIIGIQTRYEKTCIAEIFNS